jgi:hypothetical protein
LRDETGKRLGGCEIISLRQFFDVNLEGNLHSPDHGKKLVSA